MKYYKCIDPNPYNTTRKDYVILNKIYKGSDFVYENSPSATVKIYAEESCPEDWIEVSKKDYLESKVKDLKNMFYDKNIVFEVNLDMYHLNIFYNIIDKLFGEFYYQNINAHDLVWSDITKVIYYNSITNENYFKAFTSKIYTNKYENIKYVNFKNIIDEIKEINNE